MRFVSRASAVALFVAVASTSLLQAIDVWTVGINNTRQGWNRFETVLTAANVSGLKKIREFNVDEKIDVTPLVVGNSLYVFTMTNTGFVFDVGQRRRRSLERLHDAVPEDARRSRAVGRRWQQSGHRLLAAPERSALTG